jgi:hypothetical protein
MAAINAGKAQIYHATFGAMRSGGTTVHHVSMVYQEKNAPNLLLKP